MTTCLKRNETVTPLIPPIDYIVTKLCIKLHAIAFNLTPNPQSTNNFQEFKIQIEHFLGSTSVAILMQLLNQGRAKRNYYGRPLFPGDEVVIERL